METEEKRRLKLSVESNAESHADEDEYVKRFDAYRPKFEGLPEGYYPNTWGNVFLIWFLIFLVYCLTAGLFALFLWLLFLNTVAVSWIYAGCGGVFAWFVIGAIFVGQTKRNKLEKQYMQEALDRQNANAQAGQPNKI